MTCPGRAPRGAAAALVAIALLVACGRPGPARERPRNPARDDPVERRAEPAAVESTAIRRGLASADVRERRAAAEALLGAPPGASELVDALAGALRDPDRWVRESAGKALRDLGPVAAAARAALERALFDPDDYVRWRAAEALGRLGAASEPALAELERRAAEPDETEVVRAASATAAARIRRALGEPSRDP